MDKNIILIGMPSSGKSTVGRYLAKMLGVEFYDTDQIVKEMDGRALRDIVIQDGVEGFHAIQEKAVLAMNIQGCVIATGGGIVYVDNAMKHLGKNGTIIFLKLDFQEIEKRIAAGRRFARNEGQSFYDIYLERMPLYEKYAKVTIQCTGKTVEAIAEEIAGTLKELE